MSVREYCFDKLPQHAFTMRHYIFEVILLVAPNQSIYFENATPYSKYMLCWQVSTELNIILFKKN